MIFVCTDELCSTALESENAVFRCPNCGKMMKEMKEEDLTGIHWSELGIFWRDQSE